MGSLISHPSKPPAVPGACNGNAALCARPWSEVSQIGTHNSAFVGAVPTANQDWTVTQQLDSGIRFLQAQSHWENNALRMCHTNCILFDAGPATDYLSTIRKWMDTNPNEVVCTKWAWFLRHWLTKSLGHTSSDERRPC